MYYYVAFARLLTVRRRWATVDAPNSPYQPSFKKDKKQLYSALPFPSTLNPHTTPKLTLEITITVLLTRKIFVLEVTAEKLLSFITFLCAITICTKIQVNNGTLSVVWVFP